MDQTRTRSGHGKSLVHIVLLVVSLLVISSYHGFDGPRGNISIVRQGGCAAAREVGHVAAHSQESHAGSVLLARGDENTSRGDQQNKL